MSRLLSSSAFIILEVAANWLVIPQHIMLSLAHYSGQSDLWCSTTDIPPPQSATLGLCPTALKLLLINRACRDSTLCWHFTQQLWVTFEPASSAPTAWDFSQDLGNLWVDLGFRDFDVQSWDCLLSSMN